MKDLTRKIFVLFQNFANDNFNGEKWMQSILSLFGNIRWKFQDPFYQSLTFANRSLNSDDNIKKAVEIARTFAEKNL